jgi:hypothetical protein
MQAFDRHVIRVHAAGESTRLARDDVGGLMQKSLMVDEKLMLPALNRQAV